jgi:hypothetical protein
MPRDRNLSRIDSADKTLRQLTELLLDRVRQRCGSDATFEERCDAVSATMREASWLAVDAELQKLVTDAEEIEIEGKSYVRLEQHSSAPYYGCWGEHFVEEALYREVGIHNGPTVKPIELRAGMIAKHMLPDLARIVGALGADRSSREVETTMRTTGLVPPSRAFLEKRTAQMADQIAASIESLEKVVRKTEPIPENVASMSCGLDRFSVRMTEELDAAQAAAAPLTRTEPYERTPPPPKQHVWHKAWVGTASVYDAEGNELHTWRYAVEADADADKLADRVAADVARVVAAHPKIPVHVVQDEAPELRAMPEALARALPMVKPRLLTDFEHLMGYLSNVVDACEPDGDPYDWKGWYRNELLRDDRAIDRIWLKLRRLAEKLPGRGTKARTAVGKALSYIRRRKNKMRYASLYAAHLPIGSGATEGTCWKMQRRVTQPGQSWKTPGLRGILAIRGLVHSDRWLAAWQPYAATHRKEVRVAA